MNFPLRPEPTPEQIGKKNIYPQRRNSKQFFNTLTTTPAPAGLVGSKRARRIFGRARVKLGVWVVKRSSHKGFLGEGKRLLFMADSDELISPAGSFKCLQKELQAELSK
ncbi:hypothetical protein AVEN_112451-1 [Araneus ventricosus]|uniref:Uncharacterized protein n=1 Tax=Araneus ventricosus TaxID=182803 RepID=A0A4Y2NZS0_ARAVE|nr:hypothetical protein AVEN_112451-1 [Araneus ventricosus]